MDRDLYSKYEGVLAAQQAKREKLAADLERVDSLIRGLKAELADHDSEAQALAKILPPLTPPISLGPSAVVIPPSLWYSGISVRWAVLCLMAEHTNEPLGTAEMAAALEAGGVRSSGMSFVANVSAVVSDMAKKREELQPFGDDGKKYQITQKGRDVWDSIKKSRSYKFRRLNLSGDVAAKG